ncbi:MAG: ribonuclease Z [Bacteroidaceae bacterium]|nr:ribonuclease Z [Bacteroidaceae bacterium]
MLPFRLTVIGCGSALPTLRHNASAQVLDVHGRLYLIDCGEGTQRELRRQRIAMSRIGHVFISHLHGDHCFGLPGLLTTLSMLGGRGELHIHAFAKLEEMLAPMLAYHLSGSDLRPVFHAISTQGGEVVHEDSAVRVTTIRLRHRVPCVGFIFDEQPALPHIRRDMVDFLHIPHYHLNAIKQGEGWTDDEGRFYPHERLTTPAAPPRRYAYVSDTLPCPEHCETLGGADLLYHEATFCESEAARARETRHSTAAQAAEIARKAGAKRLLLGHYSARYNDENTLLAEARAVFPATETAQEGAVIDV